MSPRTLLALDIWLSSISLLYLIVSGAFALQALETFLPDASVSVAAPTEFWMMYGKTFAYSAFVGAALYVVVFAAIRHYVEDSSTATTYVAIATAVAMAWGNVVTTGPLVALYFIPSFLD